MSNFTNETNSDWLQQYQQQLRPGFLDEMWSGESLCIKPAWQPLIQQLHSLTPRAFEKPRLEAKRLLQENGITYNVHSQTNQYLRSWQLDPLPLVLAEHDWQLLEKGIQQRAFLFDCILQDLYGERRLLKQNVIPPELVFAHPGFQRPCDQVRLAVSHQLMHFAIDLARGADGQFWVLADRAQNPSGAGYALECRMIMNRIIPEALRPITVHRLYHFFQSWRNGLQALVSQHLDDARIVVLTPGPDSDTYYEHAYLATYLGYPLVQGDDLTVRDGKVWLKSLAGLQRVDIILRRTDDLACDPLELQQDSQQGVPGLLQAVRNQTVAINNPLGTSILENPGLLAFLPAITKNLLGESLHLPSIATWWCGQKTALNYVLAHLEQLVIKPIFGNEPYYYPAMMTINEQQQLKRKIKQMPYFYIGQQQPQLATTPTLIDDKLQPRYYQLRTFLVAEGGAYVALPGGLTRIANNNEGWFQWQTNGGISKDTWILSHEVDRPIRLQPLTPGVMTALSYEGILPSRAAESLFWVGRYIERAEGSSRLLRTIMDRINNQDECASEADQRCLYVLLTGLTLMTNTQPGFTGEDVNQQYKQPTPELLSLVRDSERIGSLAQVLAAFLHAAFSVRDLWSSDTWRTIDDIDDILGQLYCPPTDLGDLQNCLDELITTIMAFTGLTAESMPHESGWYLFDLGRRIERSLLQISLTQSCFNQTLDDTVDHLLQEALLVNNESLITHRRRYRALQQMENTLALLILDETNPRALAYQIYRIQRLIDHLPRHQQREYSAEQRIILATTTRLRLATANTLAQRGEDGLPHLLLKLLDECNSNLLELANTLHHTYFSHTEQAQQLTSMSAEVSLPNEVNV
ncbi:circularly permuted type 2 ATP-grasp protein [Zooshikella harenae]|uniref:Circularly permuted type 2 ATP-grasp protein n=1 Tax=Zooshikella harenae TaxID=2827238 RepID=A0ABS5ZG72_9GAMM|nr:circularly permuted type 2 ATP-grasp protein [Zooshikella harenae]MBU2712773.1 circularly permuted type 2 ATP-grasp protein [Zooshikella harenae]